MLKSCRIALLPAAALIGLATFGIAHAQSPLGIGTAEPSFTVGGPLAPLFAWVNYEQQAFYRSLTTALKAMREDPWKLTSLIALSFAYGIFHAAGPGHGKAVISSYMVANETQLRRGIVISFISAFVQGLVAVLLVGCAWLVLRGTSITLTKATSALELASFVMVIFFGLWLLFRKLRSMLSRIPAQRMLATPAGPVSMALDWTDNVHREQGGSFLFGSATSNRAGRGHRIGPDMICETCGQSHMPDPEALDGEKFSAREAWSAVVAVGLRPCSGALLVMTFSLLNGLYLGGVLSVLAMSLGTAMTVSLLAILTVMAKGAALRYAGHGSRLSTWIGNAIEILGALLVIFTGVLLLGAALQA
ncbi:nickel/cobalt transporter [Rhizobium sp. BK251]|uniref:nickel/cobalt transporter n=1 Tax=Rhizobium sp. BK251 TaxID=2512125 RepID=UPI0010540095|nr:nickel/cobalt transporter [Rhizobium sp. BK251]TCL69606.1 nickel/cobalt exporter [Rhizobium sp. BK251]